MELEPHFTGFSGIVLKYIKYQERKSYENCPIHKFPSLFLGEENKKASKIKCQSLKTLTLPIFK